MIKRGRCPGTPPRPSNLPAARWSSTTPPVTISTATATARTARAPSSALSARASAANPPRTPKAWPPPLRLPSTTSPACSTNSCIRKSLRRCSPRGSPQGLMSTAPAGGRCPGTITKRVIGTGTASCGRIRIIWRSWRRETGGRTIRSVRSSTWGKILSSSVPAIMLQPVKEKTTLLISPVAVLPRTVASSPTYVRPEPMSNPPATANCGHAPTENSAEPPWPRPA
mmetsp:Transcript_12130/g.26532  ORF Transcript_12130/g.26532 Transcript_12130/m.26532 type:complete len:226 (+) Transcript_12130:945-1622(+)